LLCPQIGGGAAHSECQCDDRSLAWLHTNSDRRIIRSIILRVFWISQPKLQADQRLTGGFIDRLDGVAATSKSLSNQKALFDALRSRAHTRGTSAVSGSSRNCLAP
jgi:hypothetical protein